MEETPTSDWHANTGVYGIILRNTLSESTGSTLSGTPHLVFTV